MTNCATFAANRVANHLAIVREHTEMATVSLSDGNLQMAAKYIQDAVSDQAIADQLARVHAAVDSSEDERAALDSFRNTLTTEIVNLAGATRSDARDELARQTHINAIKRTLAYFK